MGSLASERPDREVSRLYDGRAVAAEIESAASKEFQAKTSTHAKTMKKSQLFAILALWSLLMPINLATKDPSKSFFGGLPWWGWVSLGLLLVITGVAFAVRDSRRALVLLEEPLPPKPEEDDGRIKLTKEQLDKYDPDGPSYPHPVVITERCIGCHACVD